MNRVAAGRSVLFTFLIAGLSGLAGCTSGGGGGYFPPVPTDGGAADFTAAPPPDLTGLPPLPDLSMAASCNDGVRNGAETDLDCGGGTCAPCATGKACQKAGDCQSGLCVNQVCAPPQNACADNLKNGGETDIDCGGPTCPACANGRTCILARDCSSGLCSGGICTTGGGNNPCRNNVKDGNETDVDCGGTCFPCMVQKRCSANADCQSKNCGGGLCAPPVMKFGCLSGVTCATQCYSQLCVNACQSLINTPNGRPMFQVVYQCEGNGPCPTSGGGVCDVTAPNYDYMACQNCVQGPASLMACQQSLLNCFNDG